MFESQIQVYEKLAALAGPDHAKAALVARERRRASADLALVRGKGCLAARRYREAADEIRAARAFYGSRKLALTRLALRTAPDLVRRLFMARGS